MIELPSYGAWVYQHAHWRIPDVLKEFSRDDIWNKKHIHQNSKKRASTLRAAWSESTNEMFDIYNSDGYLKWLSRLTGISDLVPDHDLQGGGLHEIQHGGFLGLHTDFVKHPIKDVYRRVNLLIYLNEQWDDEWGGHLELWEGDKHPEKMLAKISPTFGTSVIFKTTDKSWHGHPHPLNTPEGTSRRSMALYYYTKEKPDFEISNDTVYK